MSEIWAHFVGDTGITKLSEEWVVGGVEFVGDMGRTPTGDNMSEIWEVHLMRMKLSEVRAVGGVGCRRSGWTPFFLRQVDAIIFMFTSFSV